MGPIPVVLCITKCDKIEGDDEAERWANANNWLCENRGLILHEFGLQEDHTEFVLTIANERKKRYSIDLLQRAIDVGCNAKTVEIQTYQETYQVVEQVEMDPATLVKVTLASAQATNDLKLMDWFQQGMFSLFGVLAGVVALPFVLTGSVLAALAAGGACAAEYVFGVEIISGLFEDDD